MGHTKIGLPTGGEPETEKDSAGLPLQNNQFKTPYLTILQFSLNPTGSTSFNPTIFNKGIVQSFYQTLYDSICVQENPVSISLLKAGSLMLLFYFCSVEPLNKIIHFQAICCKLLMEKISRKYQTFFCLHLIQCQYLQNVYHSFYIDTHIFSQIRIS